MISSQQESRESRVLVEHAFDMARALGLDTVMVHADAFQDIRAIQELRNDTRLIWMVGARDVRRIARHAADDPIVRLPDAPLTNLSQVHMGILLCVMNEYIDPEETVLCLAGVAGTNRLDTLVLANPRRDYPWLRHDSTILDRDRRGILTRELVRVLDVALRFAAEGREGKSVGTIFAIGEVEEIVPHVRQLILNPCEGHPTWARNIHRPDLLETLRELAALDGGFVIGLDGVVEYAGAYFDAPVAGLKLEPGLGARHAAAAGLSAATDTIAVVVSESSRAVTLFADGRAVLQLMPPAMATNGAKRTPSSSSAR